MSVSSRKSSIQIQGHSGCSVALINDGGEICVEKFAAVPANGARLKLQIDKQEAQLRSNQLAFIRIPHIRSREAGPDGGYSVRMDYLNFIDCVRFFATASRPDVDHVTAMLLQYLDTNLNASKFMPVDVNLLLNKVTNISASLKACGRLETYSSAIAQVAGLLNTVKLPLLPIGPCHGDLTLSNVLIASDTKAIGLIDFLDSYLESPLVDIAKLRQDTGFGWSLLMTDNPPDRVRFRQTMDYMDKAIVAYFSGRAWYDETIRIVQAINLLRIAPYARSNEVHCFISDALSSLELDR